MATNWQQIFEQALNRFKGETAGATSNKQTARDGEKNLIKALNNMYTEFRDRVLPKPDYDKKYEGTIQKPDMPTLKSEKDLAAVAETSAKSSLKDKREAARDRYRSEVDAGNQKALASEEKYLAERDGAMQRGNTQAQKSEFAIADRGLVGSSIAQDIRNRVETDAAEAERNAKEGYENQIVWIKQREEQERARLDGALKNFEIAEAVKAEKELKRLQTEQEKALKKYSSDYGTALDKEAKLEERTAAKIKSDEAERNRKFLESEQSAALKPYEGDREAEMQNRLSVAESFYKSLPKEEALGLVIGSSDQLQTLLGRYYDELVRRLGG